VARIFLSYAGRSLGFLCEIMERLGRQGIGFQSLTDAIDIPTNSGKLFFILWGHWLLVRHHPLLEHASPIRQDLYRLSILALFVACADVLCS
jgi:hypothetical protein